MTHLRTRHRYVGPEWRGQIIEAIQQIPRAWLLCKQANLANLRRPGPESPTIAQLAVPQMDGFGCRQCAYVIRQVQPMQEHCRAEHGWRNKWVKGGNITAEIGIGFRTKAVALDLGNRIHSITVTRHSLHPVSSCSCMQPKCRIGRTPSKCRLRYTPLLATPGHLDKTASYAHKSPIARLAQSRAFGSYAFRAGPPPGTPTSSQATLPPIFRPTLPPAFLAPNLVPEKKNLY